MSPDTPSLASGVSNAGSRLNFSKYIDSSTLTVPSGAASRDGSVEKRQRKAKDAMKQRHFET